MKAQRSSPLHNGKNGKVTDSIPGSSCRSKSRAEESGSTALHACAKLSAHAGSSKDNMEGTGKRPPGAGGLQVSGQGHIPLDRNSSLGCNTGVRHKPTVGVRTQAGMQRGHPVANQTGGSHKQWPGKCHSRCPEGGLCLHFNGVGSDRAAVVLPASMAKQGQVYGNRTLSEPEPGLNGSNAPTTSPQSDPEEAVVSEETKLHGGIPETVLAEQHKPEEGGDTTSHGEEELPMEVMLTVLAKLGSRDLAVCCAVSKEWRVMASDEALWEKHAKPVRAQRLHGSCGRKNCFRDTMTDSHPRMVPERACQCAQEMYVEDRLLQQNWCCGRYSSKSLHAHSRNVECLQIVHSHAFGLVIVSGGWDGQVEVFALPSTEHCMSFEAHRDWVSCLSCTPHHVVAGSTDGMLNVYEYARKSPLHACAHSSAVTAVRMLGNSNLLACTTASGITKVWCIESGVCMASLQAHTDPAWCIRFSPPNTLATASRDATVQVWKIDSQERSGDASGSRDLDGGMAAWGARGTGEGMARSAGIAGHIGFLKGHSLAILCMDAAIVSHDMYNNCMPAGDSQLKEAEGRGEEGRCAREWDENENDGVALLSTGSADGSICVWHLNDMRCISVLESDCGGVMSVIFACGPIGMQESRHNGNGNGNEDAARSAKGAAELLGRCDESCIPIVVSGCVDKTVRVWNPFQAVCLHVLSQCTAPAITLVAHSPFLALVAPGDGVIVYHCTPPSSPTHSTLPPLPASTPSSLFTHRPRLTDVRRVQQVPARNVTSENGFTPILTLMDGVQQSWASTLAMDGQYLAVGTKEGTILVLNFGADQSCTSG